MKYRLGKTPARKGAVSFLFSHYFDMSALPKPPMYFGNYNRINGYQMLANDQWSDCVQAACAHTNRIWAREGRHFIRFDDACVLKDYAAQTGFNPADPNTDQGTDMGDYLSYWRKTGIWDANGNKHKIDAYFDIRIGRWDEMITAMWLGGGLLLGVSMPDYAEEEFDANVPWNVRKDYSLVGGHCIAAVGLTPRQTIMIVSWGRLHEMTRAFWGRFCDEMSVMISVERLDKLGLTPDAFDKDTLMADLAQFRRGT